MVVKAGLGLIGLSAISVGGVALAKPGLLGMMPNYTTLDANASVTTTDKWVNDRKKHFVDSNNNDAWFKWSFENRYQKDSTEKKGKFQGLTTGGNNTTDKSLAKACKEAYEADNNAVESDGSKVTDNNKFWDKEIWKYCSAAGSEPKANT